MKATKTAISALVLALAFIGACGSGHHATTAGGGTGITGQTTLQGNLIDGSGPVSGVQVCILGANPAVCTTTDADGNFSVASDVLGQVILLFADGGTLGLCLSGVPEGATVTLNDVSCTVESGLCAPSSIDTTPTPAEAIQVCNPASPTPTPTPGPGGDSDGDGVSDDVDQCPGTPQGEVVNSNGCSISQLAPCDGEWASHEEYVTAVTNAAQSFLNAGLITADQASALVDAASASDCGTPADDDGDGVANDSDLCPGTPVGEVVNSDGCSVSQLVPCGGEWASHGDYVAAVTAKAQEFRDAGLLTNDQYAAIVTAAAESDCGTSEGGDPTPTPTPTPTPDPAPGDSDGDGVADDVDACPGTAPGAIVDASGCAIDQEVLCGGEWINHGDYVAAVVAKVEEFVTEGLLTEEQAIDLIVAAAQSDCGKP